MADKATAQTQTSPNQGEPDPTATAEEWNKIVAEKQKAATARLTPKKKG